MDPCGPMAVLIKLRTKGDILNHEKLSCFDKAGLVNDGEKGPQFGAAINKKSEGFVSLFVRGVSLFVRGVSLFVY